MTNEEVVFLAREAGLLIDPAYLQGVAHNLGVLAEQMALLFDPPLDPLVEPAPAFRA
jgi:hypothetical protein